MPQPYDYGIRADPTPNPMAGFLQGLQVVQALQQQKKAEEEADQRKKLLGSLGPNSTPEEIFNVSKQLPGDAEAIQKSFTAMGEGRADALWNAGSDIYTAVQGGDVEGAKEAANQWAEGFENSGDTENAQKMKTAAKMLELHPEAAQKTVGMVLSLANPDKFQKLGEKTAAIQNWEYFKEALGPEDAKRVIGADQDISVTLPNGGFYAGPRSGLAEVMTGKAQAPAVTTKEQYDALPPGSPYTDPDGKTYIKQGGPTPAASGSFRPGG